MDAQPSEQEADRTERRMDAIRLKQLLAPETLTEQELMCLQIEQNGFGCSACAGGEADRREQAGEGRPSPS